MDVAPNREASCRDRASVRLATKDPGDPGADQAAGGQFGHLARPQEKNRLALETPEDLSGQFHRHGAHRDRGLGDSGIGPDPFGDPKRRWKKGFQRRSRGSRLTRHGVRLFQLSQDLGLSRNHGVEAAGHPEHVHDCILLSQGVQVMFQRIGLQRVVAVQEVLDAVDGLFVISALGQDLDPIAGRQDHALPQFVIPPQRRQGGRNGVLAEGDPFPNLDGSRLVTQSD